MCIKLDNKDIIKFIHENGGKQRQGVKEFVEVVGSFKFRKKETLSVMINRWLVDFEKEAEPGYYLYIQDVKYHTQYRKEPDDMVNSALIIWQWRREGETYE